MKKYILQLCKSMTFGIALVLGSILGLIGVYAALNWDGLTANVENNTPLTKDLWNNTIGKLKANIDALDTRMTNVESSGGVPFSFANNADGTPSGTTAGGNSIVVDATTGLMWQSNGLASGAQNWINTKTYCESLTLGGYADWKLPNIKQMSNLQINWFKSGGPISQYFKLAYHVYWSSTVDPDITNTVWRLNFGNGLDGRHNPTENGFGLCVRKVI